MEIPDILVYSILFPVALFVLGIVFYLLFQYIEWGYNLAKRIHMNYIESKMIKNEIKQEEEL